LTASGDGTGPAAVNQTSQGIWQLQIGCLFDCTGTQQLQQATQSNTTLQAVAGSGAVDNTVTQVIWQLQIGCLFWCYDAVEVQTATGTDSTIVITPGPAPDPTPSPTSTPTSTSAPTAAPSASGDPVAAPPVAGDPPGDAPSVIPGPAAPQDLTPPAGVLGAALGLIGRGPIHPALPGSVVSRQSESAVIGRGMAVVSVSTTRSFAREYIRPVTRSAHHRERHPRPHHRTRPAIRTTAGPTRRAAVEPSGSTVPWPAVLLAAAAALALGLGLRVRLQER
jgi:hypothetical protein